MTKQPNMAIFPGETQYRAERPFAPHPMQAGGDDAIDLLDRLVGISVIDDSKPPRDADPDRSARDAAAVKVTGPVPCERCGADLRAGILQYLIAGAGQPCGQCGRINWIPSPPGNTEDESVFVNEESLAAKAFRRARAR
jgi:hypothetical protein